MFWHGGFPLAVIGYALVKGSAGTGDTTGPSARVQIAASVTGVMVVAAGCTLLATAGHDGLAAAIMRGNGHTPVYDGGGRPGRPGP